MAEIVSLGEKRFVAVVQVDGRHFLLAGGPTNIALLAQLDGKEPFDAVLKKTLIAPQKPMAKHKTANSARPTQVNRTKSREDGPQKTATARRKQPPKPTTKLNGFAQEPASAPPTSHSNGMENFGDVLQKTMSAGRQPGGHPRKQNSKSTTESTEHYA